MKLILSDLDGTIVDIRTRRNLASYTKNNKEKVNWNIFHNPKVILDNDIVRYDIVQSINKLKEDTQLQFPNEKVYVVVVSGRDSGTEAYTNKWLTDISSYLNITADETAYKNNCNFWVASKMLKDAGLNYDKIIMRPHGNYISDDILKLDWYNFDIKTGKIFGNIDYIEPVDIVAVYDDRPKVIKNTWEPLGLNIIDCNMEPQRGYF